MAICSWDPILLYHGTSTNGDNVHISEMNSSFLLFSFFFLYEILNRTSCGCRSTKFPLVLWRIRYIFCHFGKLTILDKNFRDTSLLVLSGSWPLFSFLFFSQHFHCYKYYFEKEKIHILASIHADFWQLYNKSDNGLNPILKTVIPKALSRSDSV